MIREKKKIQKKKQDFVCEECGTTFKAVKARFCYECRRRKASENARKIGLNKYGCEAYSRYTKEYREYMRAEAEKALKERETNAV